MITLEGRRALVTGGGSGIGKVIAQRLVELGARVVIAGRQAERLEAAAADIGSACTPISADVRDPAQAARLVADSAASLGGLDLLVNNAGKGWHALLREIPAKAWQNDFALNSHAAFYCAQAAFPHLKAAGNGAIVNISSQAGQQGSMGVGAYSAAKAALQMMMRVAAAEWGPHGIRVNCVAPGLIATELAVASWEKIGFDAVAAARAFPLRRPGTPEDVANAVVFLASDAASYITGETLAVNGGPQLKGMIDE